MKEYFDKQSFLEHYTGKNRFVECFQVTFCENSNVLLNKSLLVIRSCAPTGWMGRRFYLSGYTTSRICQHISLQKLCIMCLQVYMTLPGNNWLSYFTWHQLPKITPWGLHAEPPGNWLKSTFWEMPDLTFKLSVKKYVLT